MNIKTLLSLLMAVIVFSCQPIQQSEPEKDIKDFIWIATECKDGSDTKLLCPSFFTQKICLFKNRPTFYIFANEKVTNNT